MPSLRFAALSSCVAWCAAPLAAQSGWSGPVPVPELNSLSSDQSPHISADGLTMLLSSYRSGDWEIWAATRGSRAAAFGTPQLLSTLTQAGATDAGPFLRADGLEIFFHTSRGGQGRFEIMRALRASTAMPWGSPSFVTELNDPSGSVADLSLTGDGLTALYISTQTGSPGGSPSVWTASRPDVASPFGTPSLVAELSSTQSERDVEISLDGLTAVFAQQDRSGGGTTQIRMATRLDRASPFGAPVQIAAFTGLGPSLAASGHELYWCQNLGSPTFYDIFVSRFDGLTTAGIASGTSAAVLHYRDSGSPGLVYAGTLALGAGGFPLGMRQVPLDPDPLFLAAFGGIPGMTTGFVGVLDASGEASATLVNPLPPLAGLDLWAGFFTIDAAAPFGIRTISNARALRLMP